MIAFDTDTGDARKLDRVLSVLSLRRARFVCYYVKTDHNIELNELYLAREVAAWETGTDPSQVGTEKVFAVLSELQEDLLPDLDETGLVAYDRGNGSVRYGDPPEPFAQLLGVCQSVEHPGHRWPRGDADGDASD
ncbi:DUF7344 domain-containing protein [Halomicrobium salinisoli]|uniref:DUF7344 domain-containing protein n=1 Tax=Halomicrobium salinisoli TaxID=2878391 RepID=UPI001CEFFA14|nr:hypothetical protein [Halomicrobium salinisoli]